MNDSIRSVSSAQQWILCSDRVPEDGKEVLVSSYDGTYIAEYDPSDCNWYETAEYRRVHGVIAWMPLPKPYIGKGKEDHQLISTHIIWNAPTIHADPVREGKWLMKRVSKDEYGVEEFGFICSECGVRAYEFSQPYCHRCGAKMKEQKWVNEE